jgi:hypothetical protein
MEQFRYRRRDITARDMWIEDGVDVLRHHDVCNHANVVSRLEIAKAVDDDLLQ